MDGQNWKGKFFTIWSGQAVSIMTSSVLQMAIVFYLTEKTNSSMVLALATLVGFLPQGILGVFIGVWIDRLSRKLIMIGADLFIAAAGAVLAVVALFMNPPVWMIFIILFFRSIGAAFHTPAIHAVTPLLVPEDKLTKCAGYSQAIQSISSIVSPALGAILYAAWSLSAIIVLDVAGALIASLTVAMVKIPGVERNVVAKKSGVFSDVKQAYLILKKQRGLIALLWIGALYMFAFMPINALFPLISTNHFGGGTAHVALTEVVFAAGMLIGGLILGAWGGFKRKTTTMCLSIAVMGMALFLSGMLPSNGFALFVVCCGFMGFSAPFYGVQTAIFQEKVHPEYLGRVFALSISTMSLAMPLGLIAAGFFADIIGVNMWFLISGIFITAIAILGALLPSVQALNSEDTTLTQEREQ